MVNVEPAINSLVLGPGVGTSVIVACGDGASLLMEIQVGAGDSVLVPGVGAVAGGGGSESSPRLDPSQSVLSYPMK